MVSQSEDQHKPLLQQAPVVPLDASGRTASIVGCVLSALATIVFYKWDLNKEWMYIFAMGTVIGIVLVCFTLFHKMLVARRHAQAREETTEMSETEFRNQ